MAASIDPNTLEWHREPRGSWRLVGPDGAILGSVALSRVDGFDAWIGSSYCMREPVVYDSAEAAKVIVQSYVVADLEDQAKDGETTPPILTAVSILTEAHDDVTGDRAARRGSGPRNKAKAEAMVGVLDSMAGAGVPWCPGERMATIELLQKLVRLRAGDDREECYRDAAGLLLIAYQCGPTGEDER